MNENPISTRPLTESEQLLKSKFAEAIVAQSELMDKLAQQLITLELAIPGIYATILKLLNGEKGVLSPNVAMYLTFFSWFLALLISLVSMVPRKWVVNRSIMKQDPSSNSSELGIEDFFHKTAQYKRRLLIASSLFFFTGVCSAAFSIF